MQTRIYKPCDGMLQLLFQLLSSAYALCHVKSVTRNNAAPENDIFQTCFQESGCWMSVAHSLPTSTTESKTFWPHYNSQQLIGKKPAHGKCVSLSILPGVTLYGNNCIIKISPFLLLPPVPQYHH